MVDPAERPFSTAWTLLSLVLFLAVELVIGHWLGPLISGAYVSPMFHYQVQMLLHLFAFYLGGLAVGVVSPGRRMLEPAIGAFVSVLVVFLMSFFMPNWFFNFDLTKVVVGGGIGFGVALLGAFHGEKMMGNLGDEAPRTARGKFRAALWEDELSGLPRPDRDRID